MGGTPTNRKADEPAGALTEEAIRSELQQALESPYLAYSPRLRRFLSFLVDVALVGGHSPNEYSIGIDVFDRAPAFDPRIDPIVRVQARRLRTKLKEYYSAAGAADPIEIVLPLRSYVPVFRPRDMTQQRESTLHSPFQSSCRASETVALFPFTALSRYPDDEHFADGLTQEVMHSLARMEQLRVVAAHSRSGRNRPPDLSEVDVRKNVSAAVWGTVRRSAGRHRISVELVSIADRTILWSGMYEPELSDLISAQQWVAEQVTEAVRHRILHPGGPDETPAEEKARRLLDKAFYSCGRRTRASIYSCFHYLIEAVNTDPGYARGHAALAEAYAIMALYAEHSPRKAMAKARSHALTALELDPRLSEGHVALGIVAGLHDRDHATAGREFSLALDLQPKSASALHWHALAFLAVMEEFDGAIRDLNRARELDPSFVATPSLLSFLLCAAGRPAEALAVLLPFEDDEMEIPHIRWSSGVAHLMLGQRDKAIRDFEIASAQSGELSYAKASLAHALAVSGHEDRAQLLLTELEHSSQLSYVPSVHLALVRLGLKDMAGTAANLLTARHDGCPWFAFAKIDPRFQDARKDPALQSALG